jgi:hypothetical protein
MSQQAQKRARVGNGWLVSYISFLIRHPPGSQAGKTAGRVKLQSATGKTGSGREPHGPHHGVPVTSCQFVSSPSPPLPSLRSLLRGCLLGGLGRLAGRLGTAPGTAWTPKTPCKNGLGTCGRSLGEKQNPITDGSGGVKGSPPIVLVLEIPSCLDFSAWVGRLCPRIQRVPRFRIQNPGSLRSLPAFCKIFRLCTFCTFCTAP